MVAQWVEPSPDSALWFVGDEWEATEAQWAREDLISFVRRLSPAYRPAAHHFLIADALERVTRREIDRLLIVMPPRHGKSTLASRYFPAWYLGQRPNDRVMATSYADRLAYRFGRFTRNVMQSPGNPFGLRLAPDSKSAEQWDLDGHAGGYLAAGVGGSITGEGANLLLIDDPTKNAQEADSETFRERAIEWYQDTAYPRLEADGAVVVIGTQWREDDLQGWLIDQQAHGGDTWTVLRLPAIAGVDDPLGRAPGEALWPEKYPVERLLRTKAAMTSRMWQAQYQASPQPSEGGTFKRHWWRFWHHPTFPLPPVLVKLADGTLHLCLTVPLPPRFDDQLQSWDMSFRQTVAGSYTVGQVWGRTGAGAYLVDQYRARVDFPDAVLAVRAMTAKHPAAHAKLVENKANGPAIVATLRGEVTGMIEVEPDGGKEARANAVTPFVEAGNVYLPHPDIAPWVTALIDEAAAFPHGANDDQVDGLSQGLARLLAGGTHAGMVAESYAHVGEGGHDDDDIWGSL